MLSQESGWVFAKHQKLSEGLEIILNKQNKSNDIFKDALATQLICGYVLSAHN